MQQPIRTPRTSVVARLVVGTHQRNCGEARSIRGKHLVARSTKFPCKSHIGGGLLGPGIVPVPQEMSESPKKPGKNASEQEEASSSARDGNDVLGFDLVRWLRSSRDAMKEMDSAETLVLLQEQGGKDTSSNDEPGVDYSGTESAGDYPDEVHART